MALGSLRYCKELGVDFVDVLNACIARENKLREVVTYDNHFGKLDFIEAVPPKDYKEA
ncbi:MAG: hypothetical protein ACE5PM_04225 [Candidatus Hydrothermarchaeales archaeon]